MAKPEEKQIRGYLIQPVDVSEQKSADISTRPLKLAFIINEATPRKQLLKYFEYNSSVWGGFYNPFIPTDGDSLRDDWWEVLLSQEPDKIILCGKVSERLIEELHARAQPYCLWLWDDEAVEREQIGRDRFGSIPIAYQLLHVYETGRPLKRSNFRFLQVKAESHFSDCMAAHFGTLPDLYRDIYMKALQARPVNDTSDALSDYLTHVTELDKRLTPIKATRFNLSPVMSMSPESGFTVVLLGEHPVADICLFWNLRMRSSLGRTWTLALPYTALKSKRDLLVLARWCDEAVVGTNHITLASATIGKGRLMALKRRFAPHLNGRIQHVDVWFKNFSLTPIRVFETESHEVLTFQNNSFQLKTPAPTFAEQIRDGEWVIDLNPRKGGIRKTSGYLPPKHSGINSLLSGNPPEWTLINYGYSVRFANQRISYRVGREKEVLAAALPSDNEIFTSLFESKKYHVVQTDKCRYARGVIGLFGGLQGIKVWRNVGVRELFAAMRENRSYSPSEMMNWLKPGKDMTQSRSMITDLTLKKIFLRGCKLQCPTCDFKRWYPVADISEMVACAGCLTTFQPPLEALFRYRLNELVSRGLTQGAAPVLLTLLFLEALAQGSFMYVPGLEVNKSREIDVDVVATCDGHLILAECKDLTAGAHGSTVKEVISQLIGVIEVAVDVGAEIVFLVVLASTVHPGLRQQVDALRKKWEGRIGVHLLTGIDLERGYGMRPGGNFLSPEDPSKEIQSYLSDYLPVRKSRDTGWVRGSGARSISF